MSGSVSQHQIEAVSFYLGDKHIPFYATEIKELSNIDIARLLLDPPEDKIAIKPPVKCQENKVFVIDKKAPCFRSPDDWKADGLGVFKNDGSHVVAYYEDKDPDIRFISKTKESIKGKVKGSAPPSQVYDEVFEEAGGLLNVCSLSDVPTTQNIKERKLEVKTSYMTSPLSQKWKRKREKFTFDACKLLLVRHAF